MSFICNKTATVVLEKKKKIQINNNCAFLGIDTDLTLSV